MRIAYQEWNPRPDTLETVHQANRIIMEYKASGYELTLRQLYYQMVARDLIPNTQRSYKNLGNVINNGRLAGLIDWTAIVDRTRNLQGLQTWESPAQIIDACIYSFRIDKWEGQPCHLEVWVEKDALVNVVSKACDRHQVNYFSCRGYTSQSELWAAAERLIEQEEYGKETIVLHLGDHDPSGIDMTRDIRDRLEMFGSSATVNRIALTMDQIKELSPPPNPAKITDSRAATYISKFGRSSWELDALPPDYIVDLIEDHILRFKNVDLWGEAESREEDMRDYLRKVKKGWSA